MLIAINIIAANYIKSMIILGHRGAEWQQPDPWCRENSLAAFSAAEELGADGIETDIRLHNEELVIHHDPITSNDSPMSLVELLDWASDDFILNLEIKDPCAIGELIKTVKQYKTKRYLISSFWHKCVWEFKREMPDIECGVLVSINPIFPTMFSSMIPQCIDTVIWDCSVLDIELISKLSRYKHLVYNTGPYQVDGVDGIISDNLSVDVSK